MSPLSRLKTWAAFRILPVAIWSAFPAIQWCPYTWAEVAPDCFLECAVSNTRDASCVMLEGDSGEEAAPAEGCPLGATDTDETCEAPADGPLGFNRTSRAWCLCDAAVGPAVPGSDLSRAQRPTQDAIAPAEDVLARRVRRWSDAPVRVVAIPRACSPRARPPVRAPPLA